MRYRPFAQQLFVLFVLASIGLGFCGANNPDDLLFKFREDKLAVSYTDTTGDAQSRIFDGFDEARQFQNSLPATAGASIEISASGFKWLWISQALSAYYFLYFLVFMPVLGVIEKPKPRPASIAESVRKKSGKTPPTPVNAAPQHAE